jgi:hypothetical protein
VWAEWYRWLAELEIEPLRGLPRELWRYRASLPSVADLTSAETLTALGLPVAEPTRNQWPLFQDVGERLYADGCDGLIYHSAAAYKTSPSQNSELQQGVEIWRVEVQTRTLSPCDDVSDLHARIFSATGLIHRADGPRKACAARRCH